MDAPIHGWCLGAAPRVPSQKTGHHQSAGSPLKVPAGRRCATPLWDCLKPSFATTRVTAASTLIACSRSRSRSLKAQAPTVHTKNSVRIAVLRTSVSSPAASGVSFPIYWPKTPRGCHGRELSSLYVSMWDLASGEQLECPPSRGRGLEFRSSIAKFSLP
jgi:hypothetical protein